MNNIHTSNVDPLEPETLPSDPREMALRLLGMTASELREIDKNVVSGHNSIGGIRTDLNKIIADVNSNLAVSNFQNRAQQPQQAQTTTPLPTVTLPSQQSLSTVTNIPQQSIETNNPDQLELDFYKKIKPEDLEYELRCINRSVKELDAKLDHMLSLIKKNL